MGAFIASGCGVTAGGFGMVLRIMSSNPSSVKNLTLHPRQQKTRCLVRKLLINLHNVIKSLILQIGTNQVTATEGCSITNTKLTQSP
jgi:subtilase family serine protease